MFFKLLLAFTLIPAIELYLLIRIGSVIGASSTILLILITGLAGATLARVQGLQVIRDIQLAANRGEMPTDELLQGMLVLIGGFTLLTPGFITDIFGLAMLLPITRRVLSRGIRNYIRKRIDSGGWHVQFHGHDIM
jgi:UPF0716 protein FxsA